MVQNVLKSNRPVAISWFGYFCKHLWFDHPILGKPNSQCVVTDDFNCTFDVKFDIIPISVRSEPGTNNKTIDTVRKR